VPVQGFVAAANHKVNVVNRRLMYFAVILVIFQEPYILEEIIAFYYFGNYPVDTVTTDPRTGFQWFTHMFLVFLYKKPLQSIIKLQCFPVWGETITYPGG
jgi:hypothetical protein